MCCILHGLQQSMRVCWLTASHVCYTFKRQSTHNLQSPAVCREVSIWREATNKLACVTSAELSKDISSVQCMEALQDLVVAVGCEGGRVVLLKMIDQPAEKDRSSPMAQMTSAPTHDDKKTIVKVRAHAAACMLLVANHSACCYLPRGSPWQHSALMKCPAQSSCSGSATSLLYCANPDRHPL
jgi:hypothetical protein